jgi:hypothetical protein
MTNQWISLKTPRLAREGRFRMIDEWARQRITESGSASVYEGLPRASGLKYRPESAKSPLGGRIDPHLRHIEGPEALERVARADRFLRETKAGRMAPSKRRRLMAGTRLGRRGPLDSGRR